MMEFGYIGINYKNADQDIRDGVSFTDNGKIDFMEKAADAGISQCIVLSTCNRSEVYYLVQNTEEHKTMERLYRGNFSAICLDEYLDFRRGKEAIAYLFRVTAGLESMVLGEDQILGQVKEACELSQTLGYTGKELNKIVRDAVTCAKKMKTQLHISETPLSVSYVGIQQLNAHFGIQGKRALLIGSGKTAVLALRYLYEYKAMCVTVCSRTFSHAKELLGEFPELNIVPYEKRYEAMKNCDIVVSATASPHIVVRRECVKLTHPMAFLDLASPRDIDMQLKDVTLLLNLDSLNAIVAKNQATRERLVQQGQGMIEEALQETIDWLGSTGVDATIESLQQRCAEIVEDSYSYLNRKLDLTTREQKILKKILKASLHRLLREPILEMKQLESKEQQEEYQKVVRQLFQLEE